MSLCIWRNDWIGMDSCNICIVGSLGFCSFELRTLVIMPKMFSIFYFNHSSSHRFGWGIAWRVFLLEKSFLNSVLLVSKTCHQSQFVNWYFQPLSSIRDVQGFKLQVHFASFFASQFSIHGWWIMLWVRTFLTIFDFVCERIFCWL